MKHKRGQGYPKPACIPKIGGPLNPNDKNGRNSWDETAVLVAVRGYQRYFNVVKGQIICNADGSNSWDANGQRDYYLVQKMPIAAMETILNDLIMHRPKK